MPYISDDLVSGTLKRREMLDPFSLGETAVAENEGDLNYQITLLLNRYMLAHGLSYARMGDCAGACSNALAEFRRRIMDPYEDSKIAENGDVYDQRLITARKKADVIVGKFVEETQIRTTCNTCNGDGTVGYPTEHPTNPLLDGWISSVCTTCKGTGYV